MNIKPILAAFMLCVVAGATAQQVIPPLPRPFFRVQTMLDGEQPVSVETKSDIVADNGLYRRVETLITFTNPNLRVFEGELEFPVPDGATVCGYELEINGRFEPGVICEKEQARAAFDNERRKGVDPGIVEHVKGNLWKTRIYPLMSRTPRRAKVAYIEPLDGEAKVVAERDGDEVFVGERGAAETGISVAQQLRAADRALILWDASLSRQDRVAADLARLELLPEKGFWTLVVFRNVPEAPRSFTSRDELLKAVKSAPCDGGTSFAALFAALPTGYDRKFLFSDETDTLSVQSPDLDRQGLVFASRPDSTPRRITVRKLAVGEKAPCEIAAGRLLATAWAANRIADLSAQADARKDEFLELGRKYGVASPVTSLIVLESLSQYLEHKIEPPVTSRFHDEWKRRRARDDDQIAAQRAKAAHETELLRYWEERIAWWKDPIPKHRTPKSGLFSESTNANDGFDSAAEAVALRLSAEERRAVRKRRADEMVLAEMSMNARSVKAAAISADADISEVETIKSGVTVRHAMRSAAEPVCNDMSHDAAGGESAQAVATIKIARWDPKMPYLKALSDAAPGYAYAAYLKQREVYGKAPSFFLDCAGWFFRAGENALACRIVSCLAEMKLEDVALWRTMGWRLREAGEYDMAVDAFRHVLKMRGEEPQSRRDLALVLTERGKLRGAVDDLNEAASLLVEAAFGVTARRSGRRGNDMQACVLALEELNGLLSWCAANGERCKGFVAPPLAEAYRRDLPLDLRIVLSWDVDETDIDLHVLEPGGEEAYYAHRRTSSGGFVSEDVTTGYGPEEYLKKTAEKGTYRILAHYFASHRQDLTGAATVTATVYTGWGKAAEKRQILSFRLDSVRGKCPVGDIVIE